DPSLHQPQHGVGGRRFRPVGGRQRQRAGSAERDAARRHLSRPRRRAAGASARGRHMSAVVTVEDLIVGYGAVTAVERVSFAVDAGEQVTLLGPSGCGKTTILRAIAGLERPSGGRIVIGPTTVYDADAGIDVAPEKRGLAMVFQSYAIWPHMSVAENV